MNLDRQMFFINIQVGMPRICFNVAIYPLAWGFCLKHVFDPVEMRLLQIGPLAFFVNKIPKVILKGEK